MTMTQGEVLQVALATFVADGAVEWMVDEQKFQRTSTCLQDLFRLSMHYHTFADRGSAGCLRWLGHLLNFDKAHAAGTERGHFGMIAVNRNLDACLLGCCPDKSTRWNGDRDVVDSQVYKFVFFFFWHIFVPFVNWVSMMSYCVPLEGDHQGLSGGRPPGSSLHFFCRCACRRDCAPISKASSPLCL